MEVRPDFYNGHRLDLAEKTEFELSSLAAEMIGTGKVGRLRVTRKILVLSRRVIRRLFRFGFMLLDNRPSMFRMIMLVLVTVIT